MTRVEQQKIAKAAKKVGIARIKKKLNYRKQLLLEGTRTINRDHRKSTWTHVLHLVNTFGINKYFIQ